MLDGGVFRCAENEQNSTITEQIDMENEQKGTEKRKLVCNDPLSLNLYSYCHNNPIMFNDPSGHYTNPTKPLNDEFLKNKDGSNLTEEQLKELYKDETDPIKRKKIQEQQKYLKHRNKAKREAAEKSKGKQKNKSKNNNNAKKAIIKVVGGVAATGGVVAFGFAAGYAAVGGASGGLKQFVVQ